MVSNDFQIPETSHPDHSELTMIAAVERSFGIGYENDLPWNLPREYGYFTRVTTIVPAELPDTMNAVIMGRKSWDSIHPSYRPLPGRINVIMTRSPERLKKELLRTGESRTTHVASSLEESVKLLHEFYGPSSTSGDGIRLGRIFVTGGTDIYVAGFHSRWTVRLLLTQIYADYECDTFFPSSHISDAQLGTWRRQSHDKFDRWVGEPVSQFVQDGGVDFECIMFEREKCHS